MKKILVIEDNIEVRENLCEILELANYKTYEAENGIIGIEQVKKQKPDIILCDVMMPVLDGFGVLRILSRDPEFMHIPFMFLTAKAEKSDFRKGMGLGADDYITKPFDEVELLDAIEIRLAKSVKLSAITNTDQGIRTFFSEAKAEEALRNLSEDRENRKYNKKSVIYENGQYPNYLYYIISGNVKTTQMSDTGKELILNVYSDGDFLGLISLLQDRPHQETATCREDTEVLLIPMEDFRLLMFNNRDFSAKFINLLAHHASHSISQLIDLAFSSVRKKVSKAILAFGEIDNLPEFVVAREDLAAHAGTARESVIRTLADFKSEGLISIDGGKITILQQDKLENLPQ